MLKNMNLATRLSMVLSVILGLLLIIGSTLISLYLESRLERKALEQVDHVNHQVLDLIETKRTAIKEHVDQLTTTFAASYTQPFRLVGGALFHGIEPLAGVHDIPDIFATAKGVAASVFVREGDDFRRIATSVINPQGQRAVGSLMGTANPALKPLLAGESFSGKALVAGTTFIVGYRPIRDAAGAVVGAFGLGLNIEHAVTELREMIGRVRVGETGYAFVFDAEGSNRGRFLVHPSAEGKNFLEIRDADGHNIAEEMLNQQSGNLRYNWQNPGESGAREKIVYFDLVPEWNWMVGTGGYIEEVVAEAAAVRWMLFGLSLLFIPVMIVTIFACSRIWVSRPLTGAISLAETVAGGDLRQRIEAQGSDEIGRLLRALRVMNERLREAMQAIQTVSSTMTTESRRLGTVASSVSEGASVQSEAAASMAASVEELSTSIDMIGQHASEARTLTEQAETNASNSTGTIDAASQAMQQIATCVRETSGAIGELGHASEEISKIIDVIKAIADQTNLLALNAAIEAARAGEQGRGFAVVADEVRKLAERTTQSTLEIGPMIERIQSVTAQAVNSMNAGDAQVANGVKLADEAREAIANIRNNSAQVVRVVTDISLAIREQGSASASVAQNVEGISRQAEANSAHAVEAAKAAHDLDTLASQLHGEVSKFQV